MFKSLRFKVIFLFVSFFCLSGNALAQYGFRNFLGGAPGGEYTVAWFFNVLEGLTCYFIQFAIITFSIMLVVYGLMFFKGRGSSQGMTDAKKALVWGLVGGLVIMGVFTIILSVVSALGFFTGTTVDFPILSFITCL